MFDLEATIDEWRRQMRATRRGEGAVLAELEDHLREEFATLIRAGHSAPEAWQLATAKLGKPADLGQEFAKINCLEHVDRVAIGGLLINAKTTLPTSGRAQPSGNVLGGCFVPLPGCRARSERRFEDR